MGEGSMELKHLTPKQRKKVVEVLGEENIKAIDEALTKSFQKMGFIKDKK